MRMLLATCALPLALASTAVADPAVPCTDPRGCPDLIVSPVALAHQLVLDSRHVSPKECKAREQESRPGEVRLLRFNFASPNLGPGALKVGAPVERPDLFERSECHGHPHFRGFADYRLWTTEGYAQWTSLRAANPGVLAAALLAENAPVRSKMVAGHAQGCCLADALPCDFLLPVGCPDGQVIDEPAYGDCGASQGISVGWADLYSVGLDGQWVDATDLGGTYVLEVEVIPQRQLAEESYANNTASACVNIPPRAPGAPFTSRPDCIDPILLREATDCELCLTNCAGLPECCPGPDCEVCGETCNTRESGE
jgi:hypothetical protein